jgi:hypothetical protein
MQMKTAVIFSLEGPLSQRTKGRSDGLKSLFETRAVFLLLLLLQTVLQQLAESNPESAAEHV